MAEKATQPLRDSAKIRRQKLTSDLDQSRDNAQVVRQLGKHSSPSDVLLLQRTIGNQAVKSMLQAQQRSTDEKPDRMHQEPTRAAEVMVQRAVDVDGAPTELDQTDPRQKIMADNLKAQFVKFKQNMTEFWDKYGLAHPANKDVLLQGIWSHYLEGLKGGAEAQDKLMKVPDFNAAAFGKQKVTAPDFKRVLGVKSVPHPMAKPRTKEEQALADSFGTFRMEYADQAVQALKNLVDGFSAEFDKAIARVKENADAANRKRPWYKFLAQKKKPSYIFWSGGNAKAYVVANHSPDDTIMLEMTMGHMAWLDGLDYDRKNNNAPNAITAYTGQNFQIWTALSERYAEKAAAEQMKGAKWKFIGYMSDTAVDDQSVYNTIERPTLLKNLGADLDITWKLIDVDSKNNRYVAKESKDRSKIIAEMKKREERKKKATAKVKKP